MIDIVDSGNELDHPVLMAQPSRKNTHSEKVVAQALAINVCF